MKTPADRPDAGTPEARLLELSRAHGIRLACAESCTGGLVAARLTRLAGSSDMFDRGIVTYSNEAKMSLLGVRKATLDAVGAVSEEVAREMVEGLRAGAKAGLAVSITGIAGPGGSEHKPEGRVCFGLAFAENSGRATRTETVEFGALGRENVRQASCEHALQLLIAGFAELFHD